MDLPPSSPFLVVFRPTHPPLGADVPNPLLLGGGTRLKYPRETGIRYCISDLVMVYLLVEKKI